MMAVLNAHRLAMKDIENMLPDAHRRIVRVLDAWGMYGEEQTGQAIRSWFPEGDSFASSLSFEQCYPLVDLL